MEQGCMYMWTLVQSFPYPTFPISARVSRVLKFWFYQLPFQFLCLHSATSFILLTNFCFAEIKLFVIFFCGHQENILKITEKINYFWFISSGLQFVKRKGNWAISVSVQRLPQGWVTRAGKSHLKNARSLFFSFLFVLIENEILPWCNFHILALPSPIFHFMQMIFTTVIQIIKDVLLMLNVMENFYQSW